MFNNYEIKKENNEEVLYLYLDLQTEFAKTNSSKKTTLNQEINKYLKNNKINFNGKKIVLMASGLILGTLIFISPLSPKEDIQPDYNYSTNLITLNEQLTKEIKTEDLTLPTPQSTNTEETKTEESKTSETPSSSNQTPSSNKSSTSSSSSKQTPTPNKTSTSTSSKTTSTNSSNKTSSSTSSNPTTKKATSNSNNSSSNSEASNTSSSKSSITVTLKRSSGIITTLELEEYLIGVVAAEMPASFQTEALKAQAIAARTYTLKALQDGTILTDTVSTQVYKDNNELKAMWGSSYTTYYNKVKNAVEATKGLAIYYNNQLINAYYHSTSNGYTENSTAVFGSYPYLVSVESPYDKNVSSYLRTTTFTYEEISNKLDVPITSLSQITITRNSTNRVDTIIIDNNTYNGVKFRTLLGIRSTDFDISLNENNITITTRGYGHGVGMSQYGANEYAKKEWSYSQILKHYYTGVTIKTHS